MITEELLDLIPADGLVVRVVVFGTLTREGFNVAQDKVRLTNGLCGVSVMDGRFDPKLEEHGCEEIDAGPVEKTLLTRLLMKNVQKKQTTDCNF